MVNNLERLTRVLRSRGVKVSDAGFAVSFEVNGEVYSAIETRNGVMVAGIMTPEQVLRGLLGSADVCGGGDGNE